jgi:hypothetical protein
MNIGRSRFVNLDRKRRRASRAIFSIDSAQRAKHLWVLGKTGVGKSTFLENAILQDIRAGDGFALFDPHGSLKDKVLALIPPSRLNDVVLFDPSDRDFPIGFNIFDDVPIDRRPFVASSVVDCFKTIWGSSWGPQLEMFLYAASAALLDFPGGTLLGIKQIITSPAYRARVIAHAKDPAIREFWLTDFEKHMPQREQRERTLSTLNKIGQLVTDPTVRNIIGQAHSKLSFRDIMDNRKILIVSLPQGDLGMQKSSLIGALMISALHLAALQRRPGAPAFYLYVDEFHNFGNGVKEMLAGIRKFGVGMTLSHQYVDQLPEDLTSAMVGTIGTIVSFQIGGADADFLHTTFQVKPEELSSLPPYQAYVNSYGQTFQVKMEEPPPWLYPQSPETIQRRCRAQFAVARDAVERRISRFIENAA